MCKKRLQVQLDSGPVSFELRFLATHGTRQPAGDGLSFLHIVRSPRSAAIPDFDTSQAAYAYFKRLSHHVARFLELLDSMECDLIVTPPSRRWDADPYVAVARTRFPNAELIPRGAFTKNKPAGKFASPMEFLPYLDFTYAVTLTEYGALLIVDDVYSNGVTTGAIIYRLREKGLPPDANITVACPLWAHDEAHMQHAQPVAV